MNKKILFAVAAVCLTVAAQTAVANEFPEGASTPSAAELQQRLSAKNFSVKYANGTSARLQFRSNGYFFFDLSTGFQDNGTWSTEDGKLCTKAPKTGANCFPVRISADSIYLQRASGEIVRYEPR